MRAHCQSSPEAKLHSGDNSAFYGFKLETDTRQYFINCFIGESTRDGSFVAYAYDKAAPLRDRERPPQKRASVMKQLRDAQKTSKPPKEKPEGKQREVAAL